MKKQLLSVFVITSLISIGCIKKANKKKDIDNSKDFQQQKSSFTIEGTVSTIFNFLLPSAHAFIPECQSRCQDQNIQCIKMFVVNSNQSKFEICEANITTNGQFKMRFSNRPIQFDGAIVSYEAINHRSDIRTTIKILSINKVNNKISNLSITPETTRVYTTIKNNLVSRKNNNNEDFSKLSTFQRDNIIKDTLKELEKTICYPRSHQRINCLEGFANSTIAYKTTQCSNDGLKVYLIEKCTLLQCEQAN